MDILRKVFQKNIVPKEKENESEEIIVDRMAPGEFIYRFDNELVEDDEVIIENEEPDLLSEIDSVYGEFIDTVNNGKSPEDYLVCLEAARKSLSEISEHERERCYFTYSKDLLEDDDEKIPDSPEIKEFKQAFVRMLADCLSGDSSYEYYRKVKWLGPCNDNQWNVISHVMGIENIARIFEKESTFHKEKADDNKFVQ